MLVTLHGEAYLLWRAVDEHGTELDILLQKRRDKAAAKRFFRRVLRSNLVPRKIVTDQLRSYSAAKADIPEVVSVKHVFVKAAARLNNRAETVISQHANASVACAAFATRNARKNSSPASRRSDSSSRSSGTSYALHPIANSSRKDSLRGANSLNSPKIRPTLSEGSASLPSLRLTHNKLTKPFLHVNVLVLYQPDCRGNRRTFRRSPSVSAPSSCIRCGAARSSKSSATSTIMSS